jgi:hypothetical protein
MKTIDGQNGQFKSKMLKELYDSASSENNFLIFAETTLVGNEMAFNRDDIITKIFNRDYANGLEEDVLFLATSEIILILDGNEIKKWLSTKKINKLKNLLFGSPQEKVEVFENNRYVAIGRLTQSNNTVFDIRSKNMSKENEKDVVLWLNTNIEEFYINRKEEDIRICMDYDINKSAQDLTQWKTINQLLEEGMLKS